MRRKNPNDIIEKYRRGQQRRFPFSGADILMSLVVLAFVIAIGYLTFIEKPEIPTFLKLNTLTPTPACECLPTPANVTATPAVDAAMTAASVANTAPIQPTLATTATPSETSSPTATPTNTGTPTATLTPTATPPQTFDYTVQEGDTLGIIADRFGFTVDEVMAVNPDLKDASFVYVGQVIKIPIK